MAIPATPILDDFNRTNGALGSPWVDNAWGDPATWTVSANQAAPASATGSGIAYPAAAFGADVEFWYTHATLPTSTLFHEIRGTNTTGSWSGYQLQITAAHSWQLFRSDAGANTALGGAVTFTRTAGGRVLIRAIGSDIYVYCTDPAGVLQLVLQRKDATYNDGGYFGLEAIDTTVRLDDFGGGPVAEQPRPFRPLIPRLRRFGRISNPQLGFPQSTSPAAAAGPATTPIGLVTETDTAQPIGRLKSQAIGLVTVANTAQSIAARKTRALGLASELDTAQAISRSKSRPLGLVSVTNTAQSFGRAKSKALGLVLETDTVWSIVRLASTHAVGLVSELDMVFAIARVKSRAIGLVLETDTAQAASRRKAKALGLATEADSAQSFTRLRSRSLGLVSATNIAQAFTHAKRRALGLVVELDTAFAIAGPLGLPLPPFDSEQSGRLSSEQHGSMGERASGRISSSARGSVTSVQRGRMGT